MLLMEVISGSIVEHSHLMVRIMPLSQELMSRISSCGQFTTSLSDLQRMVLFRLILFIESRHQNHLTVFGITKIF